MLSTKLLSIKIDLVKFLEEQVMHLHLMVCDILIRRNNTASQSRNKHAVVVVTFLTDFKI